MADSWDGLPAGINDWDRSVHISLHTGNPPPVTAAAPNGYARDDIQWVGGSATIRSFWSESVGGEQVPEGDVIALLLGVIERIRNLHQPDDQGRCEGCDNSAFDPQGPEYAPGWPCRTARILGADAERGGS